MKKSRSIGIVLMFVFLLISFVWVRKVYAQCGVTVACADPGPPGGSAPILLLPDEDSDPDPLRLGQVYIESNGSKYGIEGARIRVSGVCNVGIPPSCDGDYYQVEGTTHADGNYYDTDFPWPAGTGSAMNQGWIKPDVALVGLPSNLAALNLAHFMAVNCDRGGDTVLSNGFHCHDPENVCPANMNYYNDCNLTARTFDIGAFDFKYLAPPTVDLRVNNSNGPITVNYNTVAGLSWTSSNATSCTATGSWSGSKPLSGTASTVSLTNNVYTYNLQCCSSMWCATDSVTVNVLGAGTLSVVKKGITSTTTDCSNPVAWSDPLASVTLQANISPTWGVRTLNYTNSTLSVPSGGTNYTVTAQNPSSVYASASNVVYCSRRGTTGAFTRTTTPPTVTVMPGQTTTVYIGFVRLSVLNVMARSLGSLPTTCAQVVGGSAISGVRASITGYSAQNLNYVFNNLIPGNYTVTGTTAPAGYSGYYYCPTSSSSTAGWTSPRIATVASGSTATMYVGVVTNPRITGTFFETSVADCSGMAAAPKIGGGSLSITGGYNPVTNSSGVYSQTVGSYSSYTLSNFNPGGGYQSTPVACQGSSVNSGDFVGGVATRNFGFYRNFSGWFQASGDVYAGGGVNETIPGTCTEPTCFPYLIKADSYGTGLARIKTGGFSLGSGSVSDDDYQAVSGPSPGTKIYDYDYYKVKMSKFNKSEWSSYPSISYSPASGDDYMLLTRTGNVTFDSNPNVGAGQKIVFLIDGDVTINSNMSVASGGYLAIIANGTITFNSNVTNAQGVFVADSISILSNNSGLHDDVLFTGQGSFIGYNSITMTRDRGVTNNTAPAETFSFRPDFVINSPLPMMTKDFTWREVVPD